MEFRPCIDIHNGKVKQIVGSSLKDAGSFARENFVSEQDAAFFAKLYAKEGIVGGHIILLNKEGSEFYETTRQQAMQALAAYPGGLQVGGGITAQNAADFIAAGASQVIVTSYVFQNGVIHYENLKALRDAVGKEHIVLDLSCRYLDNEWCFDGADGTTREAGYYIVTDRWQKFTTERITPKLLDSLSEYCCEYLIHAVDVEGKCNGIEVPLVKLLGEWGKIPVTYAGGVHSLEDLKQIYQLGNNRLNVTIGSSLDLFGGHMAFSEVMQFCRNSQV